MHHRLFRIVRPTVAAVACFVLATASAVEENAELKSVRIARTYGAQAMGPSRLVVWLGVEEPYLLDLPPGCTDLTRDPASGLTSHRRQLQAGTDAVLTAAVAEVAATGVTGNAAMGKVMAIVKPKLAGKADMSAVSGKVKAKLG